MIVELNRKILKEIMKNVIKYSEIGHVFLLRYVIEENMLKMGYRKM